MSEQCWDFRKFNQNGLWWELKLGVFFGGMIFKLRATFKPRSLCLNSSMYILMYFFIVKKRKYMQRKDLVFLWSSSTFLLILYCDELMLLKCFFKLFVIHHLHKVNILSVLYCSSFLEFHNWYTFVYSFCFCKRIKGTLKQNHLGNICKFEVVIINIAGGLFLVERQAWAIYVYFDNSALMRKQILDNPVNVLKICGPFSIP